MTKVLNTRSGSFRDSAQGRTPLPRPAATLGWELEAGQFISTLDLDAQFLRPTRPGDIAFLEASLTDADDTTIATATARARVIEPDLARS